MANGLSRYTPAIVQFQQATGGDVYCFVVDGKLGTGGMPMIVGLPPTAEAYRQRCQALIALLRRSADLLEQDIGGGAVG